MSKSSLRIIWLLPFLLLVGAFWPWASREQEILLSWEEVDHGEPGRPWYAGKLLLEDKRFPAGRLEVMYPEAFCRSGSTKQSWEETVIPQRTRLVSSDRGGRDLHLLSEVGDSVRVDHVIRSKQDEVDFRLEFNNFGKERIDLEWAQTACLQVGEFTGRTQVDYFEKCFLFTDEGLTYMDETHRAHEARYEPGQVYVPEGIDRDNVNPRPVSETVPVNGLVGCYSADGKTIVATAWAPTQEIFQGVIRCIHNDPHIGGLDPGERREVRGKIYVVDSDIDALLERFERDYPRNALVH